MGVVAYKLKLPGGTRVHPVFHVSLHKKMIGEEAKASDELPPITDDGVVELKPECILDTRWVKRGTKFIEESLVKWKKLPTEGATWKETMELGNQFPGVDLGDKVPPKGGGGGGGGGGGVGGCVLISYVVS